MCARNGRTGSSLRRPWRFDGRSLPGRTIWIAIVLVGVLAACFGSKQACGTTVIRDAVSPDGRQRAVSFYRSCGTLSHERVGVSVLPAGAPLANEDGNVFAYTDTLTYAGPSDTLPKLADIRVEWAGQNELRIIYDERAGVVLRRATNDAGTKITYVTTDKPSAGP